MRYVFALCLMAACRSQAMPKYGLAVDADVLLDALQAVENARGDPYLVGDKHMRDHAYGLLQIRRPYVEDVNRIAGPNVLAVWGKERLTVSDMRNRDMARWAATVYLSYYGRYYEKKTGLAPTMEVYARMHNGGPDGWRNKNTIHYWNKVSSVISATGFRI